MKNQNVAGGIPSPSPGRSSRYASRSIDAGGRRLSCTLPALVQVVIVAAALSTVWARASEPAASGAQAAVAAAGSGAYTVSLWVVTCEATGAGAILPAALDVEVGPGSAMAGEDRPLAPFLLEMQRRGCERPAIEVLSGIGIEFPAAANDDVPAQEVKAQDAAVWSRGLQPATTDVSLP